MKIEELNKSNLNYLQLFQIREGSCVLFKKYFLTYALKTQVQGKWTIDYSLKINLDKNGRIVPETQADLSISPFYKAYKKNDTLLLIFLN